MEIVWHYTTGDRFKLISAAGEIRPATAIVPPGEKPLVWFFTQIRIGEQANGRGRDILMEEAALLGGGIVRIGVAKELLLSWAQIQRFARMSATTARMLAAAAHVLGSEPQQWWGSFESVARDKWISVETIKCVYLNKEAPESK